VPETGAPPDGRWIAFAGVAAFGPVLVAAFHWLATFSEIPASKSPPGMTLTQLRALGLVLEPNRFSLVFVAVCALSTFVCLVAIHFVRHDGGRTRVLVGAELLAVPVLLLVSSGERWAAADLLVKHFGSAVWVLGLDGAPVITAVVCGIVGSILIARVVIAWRAERR
jgi:hypothetical protein